jgi:hypothetical protein
MGFIKFWKKEVMLPHPVCIRNEVNKRVHFGRLKCWYYWGEGLMKHPVDDMIYIPRSTNKTPMILGEIIAKQGKGKSVHEL